MCVLMSWWLRTERAKDFNHSSKKYQFEIENLEMTNSQQMVIHIIRIFKI